MKGRKIVAALGALALLATPVVAEAGTRATVPASIAYVVAPAAVHSAKGVGDPVATGNRKSKNVRKVNKLLSNLMLGILAGLASSSTLTNSNGYKSGGAG